jgi:ribosome maturation factor RimP
MIEPLCASEGIELVLVEYRREPGGRVLRLYIDKPGGVKVDDCAMISRQVGDYLDVASGLEEAYRLEVSSPGIHRPLVKTEDFERFKGRTARIRTREPLDGRRNFKGILQGISDGVIRLAAGSETLSIPFDQVEKSVLAD